MRDLNLIDSYAASCKGIVTMGYRSKTTGAFTPVLHQTNLVMYGAADAMANLVAGNGQYAISYMYYDYINNVTPPSISAITDRTAGISYFQGIPHTTGEDWLRIPIFSGAKLSVYGPTTTIASYYNSNMATFIATSASSVQTGMSASNLTFSSAANSNIIGVALVCAPVNSDSTKDIVFSRLALSSPIVVQANSYVDCFWGIAFQ